LCFSLPSPRPSDRSRLAALQVFERLNLAVADLAGKELSQGIAIGHKQELLRKIPKTVLPASEYLAKPRLAGRREIPKPVEQFALGRFRCERDIGIFDHLGNPTHFLETRKEVAN
jgi:hypothetical protein